MPKPLVGVIVSTRAEFNVMRRGLEALRVMGIPYVFEAVQASRAPQKLDELAAQFRQTGIEVVIAACSGSALLPTHLAAHLNIPVIGVPIDASPLRGQDSLFSLSMLPPGMPIATVGINNSENAALLATQMLAIKYPRLREVLDHRRTVAAQRVDSMARELATEYPDLCLPECTTPILPESEKDTDAGDVSEAVTPAPADKSQRIQPGATWRERSSSSSSGQVAVALVPTPEPQEPAPSQREFDLANDPTPKDGEEEATAPLEAETPDKPYPASLVSPASRDTNLTPALSPLPSASAALVERGEGGIDTKLFTIDRKSLNNDLIDHVMMVLLEGGIVAIPTDTVYGLAADATNRDAIERLCRVKGKMHQRTLGVLIHHADVLEQIVREVPPALERVIEECWPGALTIVFPKAPGVLSGVTRSDRIGVRIPSDTVCLEVIRRIGRPIVTRNASLTPEEPMTSAQQVLEYYGGYIDCVLDAGECPGAPEASTVLNALGEQFEILREGGVSRDRLAALLGAKLKA
ncbi:MAG: 5-(carboxyamino)imidazole ribonucleotide mutase [Candidatus Sumerlaeota bacterium]|nr:5-(carboxyamino)imidazole ribonucleotide mutase [Candidatus Sumerlaeota bacterium]